LKTDLTLDEALKQECEHGVPKVIVCPKCNPEEYVLSEKQIARIQEMFPEYVIPGSQKE
jgi:hypothetical protein